jgi:hypothetical protein
LCSDPGSGHADLGLGIIVTSLPKCEAFLYACVVGS